MSKNISKGTALELAHSKYIHRGGVPLLISSAFLRSYGCGQIDLALIEGRSVIKIYEVKSAGSIGHRQKKRLRNSASLLSQIFDLPVQIYLLSRLPK